MSTLITQDMHTRAEHATHENVPQAQHTLYFYTGYNTALRCIVIEKNLKECTQTVPKEQQ